MNNSFNLSINFHTSPNHTMIQKTDLTSNTIDTTDAKPIKPRIDGVLEILNLCSYFSSLDQTWGYWQLPMDESDKANALITYIRSL